MSEKSCTFAPVIIDLGNRKMFRITPPHVVKGRYSANCVSVIIIRQINSAISGAWQKMSSDALG